MTPRVEVVVPTWNSGRWLVDCLESLRGQSFTDFSIRLIDGGSTDGSIADLSARFPEVEVFTLSKNRGFATAVNAGISRGASPYVALLNVDTRARPDWLRYLVDALDESPPKVGAVASRMLQMERPGLIDDAGDDLSWYGSAAKLGHGRPAADRAERAEVFSVCAGAALYRRRFFEQVGIFDPHFESYFEDVDLGLRGRLYGYRYLYEPRAEVLHYGHGTGISRGRYARLLTRNRVMTLLKNLPGRLLRRHWRRLTFGQLYFFLVYRRPFHSLAGYGGVLAQVRHIARERRRFAKERIVSDEELEVMLTADLGEARLRDLLRRRFAGRASGGEARS